MQLADGDVASRTVFNWLLMDAWKLDANKVNERVISGRGGALVSVEKLDFCIMPGIERSYRRNNRHQSRTWSGLYRRGLSAQRKISSDEIYLSAFTYREYRIELHVCHVKCATLRRHVTRPYSSVYNTQR